PDDIRDRVSVQSGRACNCVIKVARRDAGGLSRTEIQDETGLPALDGAGQHTGTVSEQQSAWPNRPFVSSVGPEIVGDMVGAERVILVAFNRIRVGLRGSQSRSRGESNQGGLHGSRQDIGPLDTKSLRWPQRTLNLKGVVLGCAGVSPVVGLGELGVGNDPV